MPERKAWTPEEDKTLKYLREELQINKWSIIAKKMTDQFEMPGRTGKQCRERYHNHLDSSIRRSEWTRQEQENLYNLHDQIGNKWAIIAQKLPGRTDNCVKNHFYSRMRKAIRKLNKAIHQHFKREYKEIKMPVLYKIVEATDEKFKTNPSVQQQISESCCSNQYFKAGLKNMLLMYSNDDNNPLDTDLCKLRQLANQIHDFSNKYRQKQKKSRRSPAHDEDLLCIPRFESKVKRISEGVDDENDEYSIAFDRSYCEDGSSYEMRQTQNQNPQDKVQKLRKNQALEKVITKTMVEIDRNIVNPPAVLRMPVILPKNSLNMEEDTGKVEQLLKGQGILQNSVQFTSSRFVQKKRSSFLRRQDSYGIMVEEDGRNNMLGESVEGLKIDRDFIFQVEVDQENKLFVNN